MFTLRFSSKKMVHHESCVKYFSPQNYVKNNFHQKPQNQIDFHHKIITKKFLRHNHDRNNFHLRIIFLFEDINIHLKFFVGYVLKIKKNQIFPQKINSNPIQ